MPDRPSGHRCGVGEAQPSVPESAAAIAIVIRRYQRACDRCRSPGIAWYFAGRAAQARSFSFSMAPAVMTYDGHGNIYRVFIWQPRCFIASVTLRQSNTLKAHRSFSAEQTSAADRSSLGDRGSLKTRRVLGRNVVATADAVFGIAILCAQNPRRLR